MSLSEFVALFQAAMEHGTRYQDMYRQLTREVVDDPAFLASALRWMRFSAAACGWGGLIGMGLIKEDVQDRDGGIVVDPLMKDRSAFEMHVPGVSKRDVQTVSAGMIGVGSTLKYPCHAIIADHRTKSIVIAVRGTMSVTDAIIDLLFDPIPFTEVHPKMMSHKGILSGAREIFKRSAPTLAKMLTRLHDYKIVVCGHSLGGGTTYTLGLLMMALRDDPKSEWPLPSRDVRIELWAFAPPPMVSDPSLVPKRWRPYMHAFVYQDDIVPRSSIGAARELISWLLELRKHRRERGMSHRDELIRALIPNGHEAALRQALSEFNESAKDSGLRGAMIRLGDGDVNLESCVRAVESGTKFGVEIAKRVDDMTGGREKVEKGASHVFSKWNSFFAPQRKTMEKYRDKKTTTPPSATEATSEGHQKSEIDLMNVKDVEEFATDVAGHVMGKWNAFFSKQKHRRDDPISDTTNSTEVSKVASVDDETSSEFWTQKRQVTKEIEKEIEKESDLWASILQAHISATSSRPRIDGFKLRHPGNVYFIHPIDSESFDIWSTGKSTRKTHGVLIERSSSAPFERMIPSTRCFVDHLPSYYEWVLERAVWTASSDASASS